MCELTLEAPKIECKKVYTTIDYLIYRLNKTKAVESLNYKTSLDGLRTILLDVKFENYTVVKEILASQNQFSYEINLIK